MDSIIRKLINTHCHRAGLYHGLMMRDEMLTKARTMAKARMSTEAIISALGISTHQESNKTAQEA